MIKYIFKIIFTVGISKTGILSTALPISLYNITESNNFNHTFREYRGVGGYGCGSVLKLMFGQWPK